MKRNFHTITRCAAVAALAGAVLSARADSAWELVSPIPFPIDGRTASEWQAESLESLY